MGVEEELAKHYIAQYRGTKKGKKVSEFINDPQVRKLATDAIKLHRTAERKGGHKKYFKSKSSKGKYKTLARDAARVAASQASKRL